MSKTFHINKGYALENALVVIMVGSAIVLQLHRRTHPSGLPAPLLVRALDSMSDIMLPLPLVALKNFLN